MDAPLDRINVLHLTDLHLCADDSYESEIVIRALCADLNQMTKTFNRPDLIVVTGDLVKSGDTQDDYDRCLGVFDRIIEAAALDYSRLLFVAGNHDASRTALNSGAATTRQALVEPKTREELNRLGLTTNIGAYIDLVFSNFQNLLTIWDAPHKIHDAQLYQIYRLEDLGLNVIALNTAWATAAGIGGGDENRLLFPESALDTAIQRCDKNYKTLVIGHHPIGWLSEICRDDIDSLIHKNAAAYLSGHLHRPKPTLQFGPQGQCFFCQSGALFTKRTDRFAGYSILSMSKTTDHFEINCRSYNDTKQEFVPCVDIGTDGIFFSSPAAMHFWETHPERVNGTAWANWLKTTVISHLIAQFDESTFGKSLTNVFVEPTVSLSESPHLLAVSEFRDYQITAAQIASDDRHYVLASRREFGRTTYLKYLALEAARLSRRLPIYISFEHIRPGRDAIIRVLRASAPNILPEGMTLQRALTLGMCTIVIDDINPEDTKPFELLKEFLRAYPQNKYILSLIEKIQSLISTGWLALDLPIETIPIYLQPFSRNQLRRLVDAWCGNDIKHSERLLARLLGDLTRINLPPTPVTGAMLLTLIDQQPTYDAINRSALVEQFVELLLGKFGERELFRATFGFQNRRLLLSYLAQAMAERGEYAFSTEETLSIVRQFMHDYGFEENVDRILDQLLGSKILDRRDARVFFRYRSFVEYFIASAMELQPTFKDFLLDEGQYLQFGDAIEFFSGMRQTDVQLVEMIGKRLDQLTEQLASDHGWPSDLHGFERLHIQQGSIEQLVQSIGKSLQSPPLSNEQKDEIFGHEVPHDLGSDQTVVRPKYENDGGKWLACLHLYCKIVRNAEGLLASDKRTAVYRCIENWSKFTAFQLSIADELAKNRKVEINGVTYIVLFGEELSAERMLFELYYAIPYTTAENLKQELGSEKLKVILSEQLLDDGEPKIVTFFRIGLYSAFKLEGFESKLSSLARIVEKSDYLRLCLLRQIRFQFRTGSLDDQAKLRPTLSYLIGREIDRPPVQKAALVSREIEELTSQSRIMREFLKSRDESAKLLRLSDKVTEPTTPGGEPPI